LTSAICNWHRACFSNENSRATNQRRSHRVPPKPPINQNASTNPNLPPFAERDTLPAIGSRALDANPIIVQSGSDDAPPSPAVGEHGVWSTNSDPVGGFGESYDAQVAHGSEPELPVPALGGAPGDAQLAHEVQKTLARAHVDAADLRVVVHCDQVSLYGTVREMLEKLQIEARARAVPGVLSVTSHLKLQSEGPERG
jgi:BON domain